MPLKRVEQESRITIDQPARALEAVLARPAATLRGGAVLCHPHPQFQGSMDNAVVVAVSRALVVSGFAALRFNFGGVGRSQGRYSGGPEEVEDTRAATNALEGHLPPGAPINLVGYSYGAWVALQAGPGNHRVRRVVAIAPPLSLFDWNSLGTIPQPVSIIAAEHDQFCPAEKLARLASEHGKAVTVQATIAGADHFFWGFEDEVGIACASACAERSAE